MLEPLEAALAARDPQSMALQGDHLRLSVAQLRAGLAAERAWLAQSGVQRCAIVGDNGPGWVLADLALHLAGLPCIPLPGYFTAAQRTHALDDAGVDSVLNDGPARPSGLGPEWLPDGVAAGSGLQHWRRPTGQVPVVALPPGTLKITYTSGSTAAAKGVCLGRAQLDGVASSLAAATAGLPVERHLSVLPLATLLENVGGVHAPLLRGATCVLPGLDTLGFSHAGMDVPRFLGTLTAARPSSLILVPELLKLLVVAGERGWSAPTSLRFVAVGGAAVAPDLLERAEDLGLPVYEGYGLSECASVVCLNTPEARRIGSVGRPLPHVRLRLDGDGQILVEGNSFLGYLGEAPRDPSRAWATGDLGAIDADGFVRVRGRQRHVFISSFGRNVSPEWIERELTLDPRIAHALVVGEARPWPVAVLSPAVQGLDAATAGKLVATANARLPDYARLRGWLLADEPFGRGNGLLTANGRPRRGPILERYATRLAALYPHDESTLPIAESA